MNHKKNFAKFDEFLIPYTSKQKNKPTKEQKLYSSIDSGIFKGKKLLLPSLNTTRSTKSIVKACVFNVLRLHLKNKIFIEAFGGSASMALEARSNGCLKSYAIELDKKAFDIALKNTNNIDEFSFCIHANTFEKTPQIIKDTKEDIILYLDPPFDIREGFVNIYEKTIAMIKNLNYDNLKLVIIEHHSNFNAPKTINNFTLFKDKKFGSTKLSFYTNNNYIF